MDNSIDIGQYIVRRTACPLCCSSKLSDPVSPHIDLPYPLVPVCVESGSKRDDATAPFTICLCNDCGLITLRDYVEPAIIYTLFHNDGLGKVWDEHYDTFVELIARHYTLGSRGRIAEVGAGQGKLCKRLKRVCERREVIDPQYTGEIDNVVVHAELFDATSAASMMNQLDALVSSHTLEHFPEFNTYMQNARSVLKDGGLLFTSVPNQEVGFAKGHGNMLSFEHPSCCTNLHWAALHQRHGFRPIEVKLYKAHSIMFACVKTDLPVQFHLDARELSENLLADYTRATFERIARIRSLATPDKDNWLFGAHNNAQVLFMYGLDEGAFAGLLDNSPLKHNKRMFGTNLLCRRPSDVVGPSADHQYRPAGRQVRVFLNIGQYNDEVAAQIQAMEPNAERIML